MTKTKFQATDLEVKRGDTETYTFTVVTQAGAIYDLSTYTVTFRIYDNDGDASPTTTITVTNNTLGSSFVAGLVVPQIPKDTTAAFKQRHYYELHATDGSTVITIARGKLNVI